MPEVEVDAEDVCVGRIPGSPELEAPAAEAEATDATDAADADAALAAEAEEEEDSEAAM